MTSDSTVVPLRQPEETEDPLTAILRSGARRLLAQAAEAEAEAFLAAMQAMRLPDGRERVVRHGLGPERVWCRPGLEPLVPTPKARPGRGAAGEAARPRRWPGWRAHPLHLGDPAALGATDAEPGCAAADPLPARGLDGRLPGGADRPARRASAEPVALGNRAATGRVAGRPCALAAARPVGPALRLPLGRRRLPAGADGAAGRVHAGADRRDAGGEEGARWFPGRRARERAELARTAGRPQGTRPGDRAAAGHRRRRPGLLAGARGGLPDHRPSAVLGA